MNTMTQDWQRRILPHARAQLLPWQEQAYVEYRSRLMDERYPCFFGQAAERTEQMFYGFADYARLPELADIMRQFVAVLAIPAHARSSLTLFFKPDVALDRHEVFAARFWRVLQALNTEDPRPRMDLSPDDPLWEFSFDRHEMFVVGLSPTYRLRRSRNLGPGMVLVFQPRVLFTDPATGVPIPLKTRHALHERMLAYDGMEKHPDIRVYGDPANREWKQYVLPDDNAPVIGLCPFQPTEKKTRD